MNIRDLKVGDRVRVTKAAGVLVSVGEEGVVKGFSPSGNSLIVAFDKYNAYRASSPHYGIPKGHAKVFDVGSYSFGLERIDTPRKSGKTWIIVVVKDGKLAPASTPAEYATAEQARKVAHEMAEKHPGNEFYVFEAIGMAKAVKTTYAPF